MSYHIPLRRKASHNSSPSHSTQNQVAQSSEIASSDHAAIGSRIGHTSMFDPVSSQQNRQSSEQQTQASSVAHRSVPGHSFDQIRLHADDAADSRPVGAPFAVDTPRITLAQNMSLARVQVTLPQTSSVAPMVQRFRRPPDGTAEAIGYGHAYKKHVIEQAEFPEVTNNKGFNKNELDHPNNKAIFTRLIVANVINHPDEHKRLLYGRHAFWKKDTIVFYDPHHWDKGTCFRPTRGKAYYDDEE